MFFPQWKRKYKQIYKTFFKFRTKWALQEDKLFFNKKIYVYNQTRSQVVPVADIP